MIRSFKFFICLLVLRTNIYAQINIKDFSAIQTSDGIFISFTVAQGINCMDAEIQHSINGANFINIYTIPGICGSDFIETSYNYHHATPVLNAPNYYRINLRSAGYSNVLQLQVYDFKRTPLYIAPMPISSISEVRFENNNKRCDFYIYDIYGHLVKQASTHLNQWFINSNNYNNGSYVIHFYQNNMLKHKQQIQIYK
jgi:hypothetical protein